MKRDQHIVLVVARGEAVRNFMYSGTLQTLHKHARVTVLSVLHDERFRARFESCCDQIIPLQTYEEHRLVSAFRELLHNAHFRWVWSEAVKYYWGLHDARAKTPSQKGKRWLKKAGARVLAFRPILEQLTKVDEYLSWTLRPTRDFDTLFAELQPDLVFNCSHIHGPAADLPTRVAHRLGIPTAGFVFSWDNLTSRSRLFVPYDYFIMWNEQMRQQLLEQYPFLHSQQAIATGTPQFDSHFKPEFKLSRSELCQRIGIDPERPFVLYTTGLDSDFLEEHRIVEAVINYLQRIDLPQKPQLVVRTYIKGTSPEMLALAKRNDPDVVFPPMLWDKEWITPQYEDLYVYNGLLRHCALGINAASTVSLELMMYDKPVINLGMEPPGSSLPYYARFTRHVGYEHYVPVAASGGVMVAESVTDLENKIYRGLTNPAADKPNRKAFLNEMFDDTLDGRSGERVAEALLKLASEKM